MRASSGPAKRLVSAPIRKIQIDLPLVHYGEEEHDPTGFGPLRFFGKRRKVEPELKGSADAQRVFFETFLEAVNKSK